MADFSNRFSSDENEDDIDNNTPKEGGGAMMSIFASYYGIEADLHSNRSPSDLIDSAHFDSNAFVKELLTTLSVEKLILKDTTMVHEIRALDGDMQMLVYENYNKFISATETIKRMKKNVDAMDDDMDAVKLKMERISQTASLMDNTMVENRSKVDKLVRVRRLLSRLEFLSELPEKLSDMIQRELYKEAVQLYSKTIKVLTSHSHVLSFKNIKERTEQMMTDLRGRVMDLLDDPSLEAIKLTQHVTVLQLMEAPRDKVVDKLLTAHKRRSLRLTRQYQTLLNFPVGGSSSTTTPKTISNPPKVAPVPGDNIFNFENSSDVIGSVSYARKFHQILIVGLIEACKGVLELFPDVFGSEGKNISIDKNDDMAIEHAKIAYDHLQSCLTTVMQEYTKCLVDSLKLFFKKFENHLKDCVAYDNQSLKDVIFKKDDTTEEEDSNPFGDDDATENPASSSESNPFGEDDPEPENIITVKTARTAQLRTYEYEEENQAWMMLIKQAILDCQYMDKASDDCSVCVTTPSTSPDSDKSKETSPLSTSSSYSPVPPVSHSVLFSSIILSIIESHHEIVFNRRMTALKTTLILLSLQEISPLCDLSIPHTGDLPQTDKNIGVRGNVSTNSLSTDGGVYYNSYTAKNTISNQITLIKMKLDKLVDQIISTFSEICVDYKSIVDIYEVILKTSSDTNYSTLMVDKFINCLCVSLEDSCGVVDIERFKIHSKRKIDQNEDIQTDKIQDIYTEQIFLKIKNENEGGGHDADDHLKQELEIATDTRLNVSGFLSLVMSVTMRKTAPMLLNRLNTELQIHELDLVETKKKENSVTQNRLEHSADVLLASFSENNASQLAVKITNAFYSKHDKKEGYSPLEEYALSIDSLAVLCCILFGESPPTLKASGMDRDYGKRLQERNRANTARAGLQFDIERLFAQQIRIYGPDALSTPSVDTVVGTAIKASFKCAQEYSRSLILSSVAYLTLQAEISFIKQVSSAVLKDASGCDALADQLLSTLRNRHAEDYNNHFDSGTEAFNAIQDKNEGAYISKMVSGSLENIGKKSILLPKQ